MVCPIRRLARSQFDTSDARDASTRQMKHMNHHMSSQVLLLLPVVGGQLGKGRMKRNNSQASSSFISFEIQVSLTSYV